MAVGYRGTSPHRADRTERLTRKCSPLRSGPEEGVLEGARLVWRTRACIFPTSSVRGTGRRWPPNAIIERRGARTALIAPTGFATRWISDREPLTTSTTSPSRSRSRLVRRSLRSRVRTRRRDGGVRLALDEKASPSRSNAADNGIEAVAICFMHSYVNPTHEQRHRARS